MAVCAQGTLSPVCVDTGQGELHPGLSADTDTSLPYSTMSGGEVSQAGPSLGLGRPDVSTTVTTFQGPERTVPELGLRHSSSGQAQLCVCTQAGRQTGEEALREDRRKNKMKARLTLWPAEGSVAASHDEEPHAAPDTSGKQNRGARRTVPLSRAQGKV